MAGTARRLLSPLRTHHEALGAHFTELSSGEVPRNYGDPAAEYRSAHMSAVLVDRSGRGLIRVHGRDPVGMVHGLATANIQAVTEQQGVYSAMLTPKGRMVAEMRVFRRGPELLIDTDYAALPALMAHFRKYVPPLFAEFEDVSDDWSMLSVFGPRAREYVGGGLSVSMPAFLPEDGALWASIHKQVTGVGPDDAEVLIVRTLYAGVDGYDIFVPTAAVEATWTALRDDGLLPAGHSTVDVLRIEAGRPRWGAELTETVIPLEAGLRSRAISETKGCYTGQEVIVRILHRGHVNRHLRRLELGDVPAPSPGTKLVRACDARVVGVITSSCYSPRAKQTIGLGYVRREVSPPAPLHLTAPDGPHVRVPERPG
ncbi:MAG: glycine cleavage T C-terminal barrel domain-containing protein [Gemmatimonadota bacterium]